MKRARRCAGVRVVKLHLTPEQRERARHPEKSASHAGRCERCGCAYEHDYGLCPPGFWMSDEEHAAWERGVRWEGV